MNKAINITKLIAYQKDSIVSKELIKNPAGTVTVFAFDKKQGLSDHKVSFDAIAYITEGNAKITISKKVHKVKEGEMIIMPANKPHSVMAESRFKMLLVMIRS
ncbi:MAG: cupin domain-containing protein [bacterium]|nr:cupin domain-containing protein [bacterium]